jgi:hypothetical protein
MNESLRTELLQMKDHDLRLRQELLDAGKQGGLCVTEIEAVHCRNAARLRELVAKHCWLHEEIAGEDGAKAAWLIAQHAIGEPEFQRQMLQLLEMRSRRKTPPMARGLPRRPHRRFEGGPQRYRTHWDDDIGYGLVRPFPLEDPDHVNEFQASVGLGALHPIPPPGPT